MRKPSKTTIVNREKKKYDILHKEEKYGGKTGRVKQFKLAKDKVHQSIRNAIKTADNLLDAGCGKGAFMNMLEVMNPNMKVQGIDISKEAAKARGNIDVGSIHKMKYADEQFDIVVHTDGMEHIPVELEADVLNELFRVAKKSIYMTIAIHEIHRDKEWIKTDMGKVHCNMKTVKEWKRVFIEFLANRPIKWSFDADKNWVFLYIEKI